MTATTAAYRPAASPSAPGLGSLSIPLVVSCVVPLLVALAVGGWIRLLACILAVAAGAGLVADGLLGVPVSPAPSEPWLEDGVTDLERAS